jgi:hypothetical protein
MDELIYKLESKRSSLPSEIANVSITDKRGRLIFVVRVNATDSVSLEVFDFEEYSDVLGYGVKLAKIIRSAKCADFDAVKAAMDGAVKYEVAEAK